MSKSINLRLQQAIVFSILISLSLSWDIIPKSIPEIALATSGSADSDPHMVKLSNDNFVIAWVSKQSSSVSNIYFTIYDGDGKLIKAPTKANDTSLLNVRNWVAADKQGGFLITWNQRDSTTSTCCSVNDLYARYYDSTYTATGPSLKVNTTGGPFNDQLYPSVSFLGTYFFVGFNPTISPYLTIISGQMLTATPNFALVGGSNTILGKKLTKQEFSCYSVGLGNGTFVIVYHNNELGDHDIYFSILKESDMSFIKSYVIVNTNIPGTQADTSVALLTNQTFVITWEDLNTGGDIIAQIIDLNGNFVGSNFKVSTTTGCMYSMAKSLGDDGFLITYRCNSVFFQVFDNNGNKKGKEIKVNTVSINQITGDLVLKQTK
jgi:hypothetical protein